MKLIRTIAAQTDHNYHGEAIETSRVELHCDPSVTPDQIEILKRQQEKRLQSMCKRMPHQYWKKQEGKLGFCDTFTLFYLY
mgnify:CR=1 FL=1